MTQADCCWSSLGGALGRRGAKLARRASQLSSFKARLQGCFDVLHPVQCNKLNKIVATKKAFMALGRLRGKRANEGQADASSALRR